MAAASAIFAQLIKKGKKTIDQVPQELRKEVQEELDKMNED